MDAKCSNCGTPMEYKGEMKFRIDGYTGVGGLFLGGWNQLTEDTKTFLMYRCEKCGKVDFYDSEKTP